MNDWGIVTDLFIYKTKGKIGIRVPCIECVKGSGILEDIHARGGERQITLQDMDLNNWMLKQEQRGLCFDKFKENIKIAGLNFEKLKPGSKLCAGSAEIQITSLKKKCYTKECMLFPNVHRCLFPKGCLFASVLCSGVICTGDEVRLIN